MLYSEFLKIDNTLTEDKLDKILEAYASDIGYYGKIVKLNCENKEKNLLNRSYADQLFLYVFNTWKNELIKIYKEKRFIGKYQEMAYKVIKFLEKKNPKDYREVLGIFYDDTIDKETEKAIDALKWSRIGEDSYWQYMHSHSIRFTEKEIEPEHRLYINCNSTSTHQIVLEFIKACDALKLPYRLKFDIVGNRSDTLVIWADTKLLPKYIEILRKIKKNPTITNCVHKPPILTGAIDGWIGFASEPKQESKKKLSFNTKREKHITEELSKLQKEILHKTAKVGQFDFFRSILDEIVNTTVNDTIKYARDDETFYKVKGYRIADVKTKEFKKLVKHYVYNHQQDILDYALGIKDTIDLSLPFKKSKIVITFYKVNSCIKRAFCEYAKNNPNVKKVILEQLKNTASTYGIDKDRYYFDFDKEEMIKKASLEESKKKQSSVKKTQIKSEVITLYTTDDNKLFYMKEKDVDRFHLHSACNPCMIGNELCYRISSSDAKRVLDRESDNTSTYKVDLIIIGKNNNKNKQKNKISS